MSSSSIRVGHNNAQEERIHPLLGAASRKGAKVCFNKYPSDNNVGDR